MGTVDRYPPGTFCWVDLGTPDVEGAQAFYGGLFGWEFADVGTAEAPYVLCRVQGEDVAGIHAHPDDEGHDWTSYVSVEDADATQARAAELGGEAVGPAADLPGTARVGVIRDPFGVELVAWQPAGFDGASLVNEPGAWTWNELTAPSLPDAASFYGGLFGWTVEEAPGGARAAFGLGELLVGGVHEPFVPEDPPRWTVAFWVDDVHHSVALVEDLGGRILLPPTDIPVGRFAIVADPRGASFTISAVPGGALRGVDGS